ncbi:hypothetical protein HN873_006949 [Arachis hypogaea]
MASCGGLIRNCQGRTIAGFMMNLENCLITLAEIWGLYAGIKLARDLGIEKLLVETDSLCTSNFIQNFTSSRDAETLYCVPSSCFLLIHGMFVSPMSTEKGISIRICWLRRFISVRLGSPVSLLLRRSFLRRL